MMFLAVVLSVTSFFKTEPGLDESRACGRQALPQESFLLLLLAMSCPPIISCFISGNFWETMCMSVDPLTIFFLHQFLHSFFGQGAYDWKSRIVCQSSSLDLSLHDWLGNEIRIYSLLTLLAILSRIFYKALQEMVGKDVWRMAL